MFDCFFDVNLTKQMRCFQLFGDVNGSDTRATRRGRSRYYWQMSFNSFFFCYATNGWFGDNVWPVYRPDLEPRDLNKYKLSRKVIGRGITQTISFDFVYCWRDAIKALNLSPLLKQIMYQLCCCWCINTYTQTRTKKKHNKQNSHTAMSVTSLTTLPTGGSLCTRKMPSKRQLFKHW